MLLILNVVLKGQNQNQYLKPVNLGGGKTNRNF